MALNPPISSNGLPLRVEGEYMVLERKNIEAEFKIEGYDKKKTGKGKLYLTTCRLVFVHKDFMKNEFNSFDIPLAFLSKEKFEQPIFGSNYLAGTVKPLYNLLPGNTDFKLWFTSGGCNTFLKLFCYVLDQVRKQNAVRRGPDQAFLDSVRMGKLGQNVAFVDPNDPSVIYVSQPEETYDSVLGNQKNQYYGTNYNNLPTVVSMPPSYQSQNMQEQMPNMMSNAPPGGYNYPPMPQVDGGVMVGSNDSATQASQSMPPSYQAGYQQPAPGFIQPGYQQPAGAAYMQPPGGFQQAPGGFQQAPGGFQQAPGGFQQAPGGFQQAPAFYDYSSQSMPSSQQQIPGQGFLQQAQQPLLNSGYYYGFGLGPKLNSNR